MVRDDRMRWGPWAKGVSLLAAIGGLLLASGDEPSRHQLRALAPPMADSGTASSQVLTKGEVTLFHDWPKQGPTVALLLTGQMFGYYDPCGCSHPQKGGLERRYNFALSLRDKGWKVVPIDLGDIFEERGRRNPQSSLKYRTNMAGMKRMGYQGVGLGLHEMEMPLLSALAEHALNDPNPPVIGSNLLNREQNFPGMVTPWAVTAGKDGAPKVGIISIVGPTVAAQVPQNQNPAVQFTPTLQALPQALLAFQKQKVEIRVLLYQGTTDEAKACAARFPELDVIVVPSKEDEPSEKPIAKVGETLIVGTGHKGRYVGVVGCFPANVAGRPFELRYQLVAMSEDLETSPGQEANHPIIALLEDYAKEVARGGYLNQYPRTKHPIQLDPQYKNAHYVGSAKCRSCHKDAYQVWENHPHAHAYETLVNVKQPSLRHLDGECVSCHVVGFNHDTGYEHQFTFGNDKLDTIKETVHLRGVGCENCHGPGSAHIADKNNKHLHDLMNPYRYMENESPAARQRRHNLIDRSCQQCHDQDNDVNWEFIRKYPATVHPEKDRKSPY